MPEKPESESLDLDIVSVSFKDERGNILETPISGEAAYFCVECKAYKNINNVNLCVLITDLGGENEHVLYLTSASDNERLKVFL